MASGQNVRCSDGIVICIIFRKRNLSQNFFRWTCIYLWTHLQISPPQPASTFSFFRSLLLRLSLPNTRATVSMNEFLANPAVQAGLAPFAVALIVSALLLRTRLMGLAIGAGFATVIVLAIGFSFEPLTAVRKMVLSGAGACVLLLLLELRGVAPRAGVRVALAVA